jgi:glutathione peroxidase
MSIYDLSVKDEMGDMISLSQYKGKVLLIVNTASKCGFTPQFEGLQALYEKFGNDKFEILGFPCNQFANQDPGDINEIKSFCSLNYGVTFPMFDKIDVNGPEADPLYVFLKDARSSLLGKGIKWNFTKFLLDAQGNVVERFAPNVEPIKLESKIKKLIDKAL